MIKKLMVVSLSSCLWFSSAGFVFAAEQSGEAANKPGVIGKPGFWNTKSKKKLAWGWGLLLGGGAAMAYGMGSEDTTHNETRSVTSSCGPGCTSTQIQTVQVTESEQKSAGLAYAGLGAGVLGASFLISNLVNSPASVAKADSGFRVSPTYFVKAGNIVPGVALSCPFGGNTKSSTSVKE